MEQQYKVTPYNCIYNNTKGHYIYFDYVRGYIYPLPIECALLNYGIWDYNDDKGVENVTLELLSSATIKMTDISDLEQCVKYIDHFEKKKRDLGESYLYEYANVARFILNATILIKEQYRNYKYDISVKMLETSFHEKMMFMFNSDPVMRKEKSSKLNKITKEFWKACELYFEQMCWMTK